MSKLKQDAGSKSNELKEQAKAMKELQSKAGAAKAGEAKAEKDLQKQLDQRDKQLSRAADENKSLEASVCTLKEKLSNAESQKKEINASTKGEAARYGALEAKYDKLVKQNKQVVAKAEESSQKGAEASEAKHEKLVQRNAELAAKAEESSKAAAEFKVKCTEMQKESDLLQIQAEEAAKREEALNAKIAEMQEQQALHEQQALMQSESAADSPQMSPSDKSFVALFGEKAAERHLSPKRSSGESYLGDSAGARESPARKSRRKSSLTPRRHSQINEDPVSPFVAWADKKDISALEKSPSIDELDVPHDKENGSGRVRSARTRLSTAPTAAAAAARARVSRTKPGTKATDRRKSTVPDRKAQRVPVKATHRGVQGKPARVTTKVEAPKFRF